MSNRHKYVSSLDLKYLDSKFITIPQGSNNEENSFNEIHKTRIHQLPSILAPINKQTSDLETQQINLTKNKQPRKSSPVSIVGGTEKVKQIEQRMTEKQKKLIQKYKNAIHKMKEQDQILHSQIAKMYKNNSQNNRDQKVKPIRNILMSSEKQELNSIKTKRTQENKPYANFYQNLYQGDSNPYKKRAFEIQQKFIGSNIYKSFQNYLSKNEKRIPEFLKAIR